MNKDESEVFLGGGGDMVSNDDNGKIAMEKAFDFTSINDYKSIYKYNNRNSLLRDNQYGVDCGIFIFMIN